MKSPVLLNRAFGYQTIAKILDIAQILNDKKEMRYTFTDMYSIL